MDVRSEKLYFFVSGQVSADDGVTFNTVPNATGASAFLDTMADLMHKMLNRITTPSTTIISGGSAAAVAITVGTTDGASGYKGYIMGMPFTASAGGHVSADPSSALAGACSTASNEVRKVLVCLEPSSGWPIQSSLGGTVTVAFVNGSAFTTTAGSVASGGVSATFNQIPLPKPSAQQIPVGWLNIPNSYTSGDGITTDMMIHDYRETQGANLSLVMTNVQQP